MNPFKKRTSVGWAVCRLVLFVLAMAYGAFGQYHEAGVIFAGVDSTTFLPDMKILYGALQDQISTKAALVNLFGDGSKFGKPENKIGVRGYTFLARLTPNWNMGFRKEGTTGVGTAGNQGLANSVVNLKYAYIPTLITGQAENLSKDTGKAFMQAKALEAKFDMLDIISHVNVIMAGAERGGQLAQVSASGVGTFTCSAAGLLPAAIYLRVGMPVDAGPVGGGANSITNATILTINYTTGVVTHSGGGTATIGHAIYLSGEAPLVVGDFPMTCEGLNYLTADTGALQGLDPAVAGQAPWKGYLLDVGATALSSQVIHQLRQFVKNRSGLDVDTFIFPSSQINQLVTIATQTIRFDLNNGGMGKKALDLGFSVFEYAGLPLIEEKDCRLDRFFGGASEVMKKFEALPLSMANDEAGEWTRVSGANGIADAVQGLLRWYFNIGTLQRSGWGQVRNLTVPANFANQPATL